MGHTKCVQNVMLVSQNAQLNCLASVLSSMLQNCNTNIISDHCVPYITEIHIIPLQVLFMYSTLDMMHVWINQIIEKSDLRLK